MSTFIDSVAEPLTIDPAAISAGKRIFDEIRLDVQLKPIEKLARSRVLFHHISAATYEITERLQNEVFGWPCLSQAQIYGDFVKEYHVHALLSNNVCFRQTSVYCVASGSYACSFETHELVERVAQKAAVSLPSRDHILVLPDDVSSGSLSIADVKRYSATPEDHNANKMHVEVLSLTGPSAVAQSAVQQSVWLSPILYCKYSVNVIVIDMHLFFNDRSLYEDRLCKILCEIRSYCSEPSERNAPPDSKVLLVVVNAENCERQLVKDAILNKLQLYRPMLILTDDGFPFVSHTQSLTINRILLRVLTAISRSAVSSVQTYRYPHAGVMLSQQLSSGAMSVVDLHDLWGKLRDTTGLPNAETAQEGILHYLQNTGLAYIPGESHESQPMVVGFY